MRYKLTPSIWFRDPVSGGIVIISPETDLFQRLDWLYGDAAVRMSTDEWEADLQRWHTLGRGYGR